MKFTPWSRARGTVRAAVGSSVGPPNIMAPRQSRDTRRPLRPKVRYSIARFLCSPGCSLQWPDDESHPCEPWRAVPQFLDYWLHQYRRRADGLDPARTGGAAALDRRPAIPCELWTEPNGAGRNKREPGSTDRDSAT